MNKIYVAIGLVVVIIVAGVFIKLNDEEIILDSGIYGQVHLGPICPTQKEEDDSCNDKPYKTTIEISFQSTGGDKAFLYKTIETDEHGQYTVMLPSRADGVYHISTLGGQPYPLCEHQRVNVDPDTMLEVNITCDTGIR